MKVDYRTPMFSIIVPVYKVEKYLRQCVDSLLAQDFDDYEIILVDDGSPDSCPQICDEYATQNKRVNVVHKPNGGLSDARNAGVMVARGEYLTFVDSDDFWKDTDVLAGVASIINQYHPDVVVSDFIKYYTDSNNYIYPSKTCDIALNGKPKIEILKYLYFCHADLKMSACQKFAKRELLTRNPFTKGLLSEDIDWSLSLYPAVNSICVYPKPYYCYRQMREGSITNMASQRSFDSLIHIVESWKVQIPKLKISEEEKGIYMGYLAYQLTMVMLAYTHLSLNGKKRGKALIKRNIDIFNYPLNYKTKRVRCIIRYLGVSIACRILKAYLKTRRLSEKSK